MTCKAIMALALTAGMAQAEPAPYLIDTAHSQILFSFDHHGYSPVTGLITGISGEISYDAAAPGQSSVSATIPLSGLTTGHAPQDADILSPDFLDAAGSPEATFRSTAIKVTGVKTALIEGELSLNGVTLPVVLDTTLNRAADTVRAVPTLGFTTKTRVLRSEFGAGRSAPANSDTVDITLAIEATDETGDQNTTN